MQLNKLKEARMVDLLNINLEQFIKEKLNKTKHVEMV
jgi:hypothetical protein